MANSEFKNARISGITMVVPQKLINIDDEIEFYADAKQLARNKKILGLGTRRVVDDGVTASDMCYAAAEDLFAAMKIDRSEIDALIYASTSPDYQYPATSCILQGRLGLSENCACYDQAGLACSGYVYALWSAHALVSSGAVKKCLVLAGDTTSLHSDKKNRISNMLYGDAGTATLVEYDASAGSSYFNLGTNGKMWDKIVSPAGGYRLPIKADIIDMPVTDTVGNVWYLWNEVLKGMDIFRFTMEAAPACVNNLLDFSKLTRDDIDFFAFHQANGQIVRTIAERSGIPPDKYSAQTFSKYGNCGTAAVISVLCDRLEGVSAGKILLCTFGVGLSWAGAIVDFSKTYNGGIRVFETPKDIPSREEKISYWTRYFKGETDA